MERDCKNLAEADSLRLTITFLNGTGADGKFVRRADDQMLRARIFGGQYGVFDISFDTLSQDKLTLHNSRMPRAAPGFTTYGHRSQCGLAA